MNKKDTTVWSYWSHEPLRHLRRMGNDGDSIFTLGDWAEDWYARIHSEELLQKGAELGVNMIYTHFFKGFGLETEKEEMENTRMLCKRASEYGIRVLGYCQLGSLYYETFCEEADVTEWAIRTRNGEVENWVGQYYRLSPCFNNRAFIAYIKKVIRYGITHVGLSGFHFDNSYNKACYCEKCTQAFREYLTEHVKDPEKEMGLRTFRYVQIPKEDRAPETHDPLFIRWLEYKADLCAKVHRELFAYVKEISGGKAIVLHNPCFPRPGRGLTQRGFEPSRVSSDCDYIFAENSVGFIRMENGRIKGQADAFKFGERFGYQVLDACWTHNDAGKARLPYNREEVVRFQVQSMIFGGLCGSPWTVRSIKDGHKNILEDNEVITPALKEAFDYYYKYQKLFRLPAENYVKILYVPENVLACLEHGLDYIRSVVEELVTAGIPFSFVTEEDLTQWEEKIDAKEQVLLIPRVVYASEPLLEKIEKAAAAGTKIILSGPIGRYYQDGKERRHSHRIFTVGEKENFYREELDFVPRLKILLGKHDTEISKPGIMLERKQGENGECVLHLLHVDNEKELETVSITLHDRKISKVDCVSLEGAELAQVSEHTITLKNLRTTATLVIEQ